MNGSSQLQLRRAARIIQAGGVVAYPTEAVYGLGCDPEAGEAVLRILALKQRPMHAGLILIASDWSQLDSWIAPGEQEKKRMAKAGGPALTWVVTAAPWAPAWITGGRETIAVRVTEHPVAAMLCALADSPLVSTSANRRGHRPAGSALAARRIFGAQLDLVVNGATGGLDKPSEIRDARSGKVLRQGGG